MTPDYKQDQKQRWINAQLSWIEAVYDAAFNNNETPPEGAVLWLYIIQLIERDQSRNKLVTELNIATEQLVKLQRRLKPKQKKKRRGKQQTRD